MSTGSRGSSKTYSINANNREHYETAKELACAFQNLTVEHHGTKLINNVTGYVRRSCITAVLGPSASGKSVLLQALSGQIQDLDISGSVYMSARKIDPKSRSNPVAYVPQEDVLIGELTAREMTTDTALLKRVESRKWIDREVSELLKKLGLGHVADGIIGTLIFRGLSGGQKKRAQVAAELIASPSMLMLDEPTSGLDSSAAYEALSCVRDLVKNGVHGLSVMVTIHQPNSKLLSLFDDILLLDGGEVTFFGTVPKAERHFSRCGFPCPKTVTPTDFFLQVSASNFSEIGSCKNQFDFKEEYRQSADGRHVQDIVRHHRGYVKGFPSYNSRLEAAFLLKRVALWKQVYTLVYREYAIAYRDPTLYYFQFVLLIGFAVMTGGTFWNLPQVINGNFNIFPSALLWLVLMNCWIHAFKVYYLSTSNKRSTLEIANGKCFPIAVFLAEFISTSTLVLVFCPVGTVAYYMIGFPSKAFPFVAFALWISSLAAEAMIAVLTKLSKNATTAMVFAMVSLVTLQVFGGGVFISWQDCPDYWLWLQEITVFTQATRAINIEVLGQMLFECVLTNGVCVEPGTGNVYECAEVSADGNTCQVSGHEILYVTQGINVNDDHWAYLGYLILIYFFLKMLVLFFTFYPLDRVKFQFDSMVDRLTAKKVMDDDDSSGKYEFKDRSARSESNVSFSFSFNTNGSNGQGSNNGNADPASANATICSGHGGSAPTSPHGGSPEAKSFGKGKSLGKRQIHHSTTQGAEGDDLAPVELDAPLPPRVVVPGGTALSWTDFSVTLPKTGAKLIDNVSGYVRSGSVLALMGPSGAGKTTLLNGLSGQASYAKLEGDVKFANRYMTKHDLTYVPQFDELNDVMTVYEHIALVGRMTCVDQAAMMERLDEILDVLGLTRKRNVRVRNLSGGEIKRLSIGVGLISKPSVLFLDEPTTGLDSTAAYSIARYLVKLARRTNVAIIMTIHQPSTLVFESFDDLFLLEQGHLVFFGSIPDAAIYFTNGGYDNPEHINPADYYLDLVQQPPVRSRLSSKTSTTWTEEFMNSAEGIRYCYALSDIVQTQEKMNTEIKFEIPGVFFRLGVMIKHFFNYFRSEPGYFVHRLYALLIIALLLGTLFLDLQPLTSQLNAYVGALFSTAIAVMLSAVASTALFARDRREAVDRIHNGFYQPGVFVAAQFTVSLVYNLMVVAIFMSCFHWMTNLNPSLEAFLYSILISWGHVSVMESFLMILIECLKNEFLSTSAGMIFLGSNMLFAGFFRHQTDMPPAVSWLCYVFPLHWSFNGFAWEIFENQDFTVSNMQPTMKISGKTILEQVFQLHNIDSWNMFALLMVYVIGFRFIQYILLAYQTDTLPWMFGVKSQSTSRTKSGTEKSISSVILRLNSNSSISLRSSSVSPTPTKKTDGVTYALFPDDTQTSKHVHLITMTNNGGVTQSQKFPGSSTESSLMLADQVEPFENEDDEANQDK